MSNPSHLAAICAIGFIGMSACSEEAPDAEEPRIRVEAEEVTGFVGEPVDFVVEVVSDQETSTTVRVIGVGVTFEPGWSERDLLPNEPRKIAFSMTCLEEGTYEIDVVGGDEENNGDLDVVNVTCVKRSTSGVGGGGTGGSGGAGAGGSGGEPPLEGDADPIDDCEDDYNAVACDPEMDVTLVHSECTGNSATARIAFAAPALAEAAGSQERTITFIAEDPANEDVRFFARANSGPYTCEYIADGMYMPLPAGAACAINDADGTLDVHLPNAGFAIAAVEVRSTGWPEGGSWKRDTAGPFACD